jgi:hypothetical protein
LTFVPFPDLQSAKDVQYHKIGLPRAAEALLPDL